MHFGPVLYLFRSDAIARPPIAAQEKQAFVSSHGNKAVKVTQSEDHCRDQHPR
jgi:hypothetical protein